jgi:hypothetical protein
VVGQQRDDALDVVVRESAAREREIVARFAEALAVPRRPQPGTVPVGVAAPALDGGAAAS